MNNLSIITDRERELAERLRVAEQQRDELAAQVEAMRGLMNRARRILTGGNPRPTCNWGMLDTSTIPDTAAILRRRDARTLRDAAQACYAVAVTPCDSSKHSLFNMGVDRCARSLCAKATELEAQHG